MTDLGDRPEDRTGRPTDSQSSVSRTAAAASGRGNNKTGRDRDQSGGPVETLEKSITTLYCGGKLDQCLVKI